MPEETLKVAIHAMDNATGAVSREFATVRTGKSSPALLDTIRVEAYGSLVPLKQDAMLIQYINLIIIFNNKIMYNKMYK